MVAHSSDICSSIAELLDLINVSAKRGDVSIVRSEVTPLGKNVTKNSRQ